MPTYEYACDACGHAFERFHSMLATPIRKCPACGKLKVQRKIGIGAGVIFKGGGFYETDYRGDAYQKAKAADGAPPADAATSTEKPATDAKPADPKADAKPAEAKADASPAKAESPKPAEPKAATPKKDAASKSAKKR